MKKKLIQVKDFADKMDAIKRKVKNAFSEEGAEAAAAIRDLIDELENAEIEIDERELASRIEEVIRAYNGRADEEVPANVANALAKKFAELQNTMPVSDKLTPAVKNQVAAAILRAKGKEAVKDAVNAVLVKNGITGLTFNDTIDFAINDNWGDSDELFAALKKVNFSKFLYTSQDFNDADVVAHGWAKTSETEKEIQALTVNGKKIDTQYIYKRQQIAFEDLDDIEESGSTATFLRWLDEELDRQIVNAIVAVMLGNTTGFTDITTIESLRGTGVTDVFRTAVTVADATAITFAEARSIADSVIAGRGAKWMVMSQTQLTALAKFKYASGGDDIFRSKDEVAAMLGVERIYVTDKANGVVCFIPSEYWVKEKASMQVSYPKYEYNVMNYQRERNIGGAIHGLKSVAFGVEE
jgi:molecular chaperone GrpE (heat shock protein)